MKRQCRTLRISAEQNTSGRIADDCPLLSWLPRFAAQVVNKMRIGKDGKTSEMSRTGRRWRKPLAQFGESLVSKNWRRRCQFFCKPHHSRNLFVGHRDRTGAVFCITKSGVVRGKSWTRQTISDAWESTNWEGLCGTPWQKKVTADEEGAGDPIAKDCG